MPSSFIHFLLVAAASAPARYGRRGQSNTKQARKALSILLVKPKLIKNESANEQENGKGVIPPPIRPDERSTELHPYSPGPCTSLSPGGWPPILDLPIFKRIPGSIWFSIKVILFLFLYIWVRAAFPRYRYDQLMGLGRKVFLPLSLARVVAVSGVSVTFPWLP
ncbi:hypothetical protein VNO78_35142 [Psophocarpus tetragonolobus]|uniref:NADH-ubiquinone oxidoreductase chain 1 n=1 Tax=Psophocarpus tetragonolobus TaxID=3891 RepID=A0AAN9RGV4_PSOTE